MLVTSLARASAEAGPKVAILSWNLGARSALRTTFIEIQTSRHNRGRFGGTWIADSEQVLLLFEPGRYPVAYFPEADVSSNALERTDHTIQHPDLGLTS